MPPAANRLIDSSPGAGGIICKERIDLPMKSKVLSIIAIVSIAGVAITSMVWISLIAGLNVQEK